MTPDWERRIADLLEGPGPRMVFQPIRRLEDGALLGYEALSRFPRSLSDEELELVHGPDWRLGGHGSEGPAVWFRMAEQFGRGLDLEVAAVCNAVACLPSIPDDCYLAVNTGPETLTSGRLAAALEGVDLSRVVVELTEHDAITDYAELREAVVDLQKRTAGHVCARVPRCPDADAAPRMAADDVGAGEALRHLLEISDLLDLAKLDMHVTVGIDQDKGRQYIASAVVGMGRVVGFRVVAEGVEHAAQVVTLHDLGVYAGQGWHLGRPGPLPKETL